MKKNFLIIVISFLAVSFSGAQSRYLENGIGGSAFQFTTVFDDTGWTDTGLSAAYSIGGIMDIGFRLNRNTGTIGMYEKTEWGVAFLYNIVVIKQTDFIPFSFQLEGSYGYNNVSSDYLDYFDYTKSGQGFEIGGSVYHHFHTGVPVEFLLGIKANYLNYLYTEIDNQDPAAPVIHSTERTEVLKWGGLASILFKFENWPVFVLQTEVFYNQATGGYSIESAFFIIAASL